MRRKEADFATPAVAKTATHLGDLVRQARLARSWTRQALAERARISLATLKRLPEIGVNFIDTADSYGPDVSEELIREALYPYKGLLIATKGGLTRGGPDQWTPNGRPDYLIGQAKKSLAKLGVEQIDLWQLHRIDSKVPRDEQFAAVRQLIDQGIIAHAGLSEVSVSEIEAAR